MAREAQGLRLGVAKHQSIGVFLTLGQAHVSRFHYYSIIVLLHVSELSTEFSIRERWKHINRVVNDESLHI